MICLPECVSQFLATGSLLGNGGSCAWFRDKKKQILLLTLRAALRILTSNCHSLPQSVACTLLFCILCFVFWKKSKVALGIRHGGCMHQSQAPCARNWHFLTAPADIDYVSRTSSWFRPDLSWKPTIESSIDSQAFLQSCLLCDYW